VSESWIEEEVRAALNETYRPAPELLSVSVAAIRSQQPRRHPLAWVAGLVAALLTVSTVAVFVATRNATTPRVSSPTSTVALLPRPIAQPISRTSAEAQVAWLSVWSQGQEPYLVAVDPSGRVVARLHHSTAPGISGAYGVWRSADGATVFTVASDQITAYSALDGKVQRTYARAPGDVVGDAFSPDGHWLAVLLLNANLQLQVIDLRTGSSQMVPVSYDSNAANGDWGMVIFAPNSARVYTLTWGGLIRLSAFSLGGGKLNQIAASGDGQAGCAGPAMAASVVAGGQTLVAFCHVDGAVWFFDLHTLASIAVVRSQQANPFWLSPIFTPDGHLLYLHGQWPGLGDSLQVVDLTTRKLLGPLATPIKVDQSGPFAWLITNAYAGGVASTVPISPDGLRLYSTTDYEGVMVLRVPDLKPIAKLAPGFKASEVWVSGDGRTVYATSGDGKDLLAMGNDGSHQKVVTLPGQANGFIASEHG
jgi:DNA-binding beta-propeller fold protein YncE